MKTGRKESPQKGNEEGGLSSDGVVVYEYLNKQEADFLYHEIFVHQCYFSSSCVSSTENDISEMCDEEKEKEKEVRESDDIQLSINDGDCVVDIGANIGLFSLFCLAIADNLTIIACEPIPDICRVLHRNLQSYKKNNKIFIQQCAVGKTLCLDETFVFNRNAPGESCRLVNYDEYKQQQDVLTSIKGQINYENCIIDGVIGGEKGENTSSAGELRSGVAVGVNNDDFNETLGRVNGSVLTLSDVIKSTIDKWLPKEENQLQFIANIDILKIDCEGDELEVLLGIDASCTCSCTCGSGDDCSCMHIWPCLWGRIQQVVAGR